MTTAIIDIDSDPDSQSFAAILEALELTQAFALVQIGRGPIAGDQLPAAVILSTGFEQADTVDPTDYTHKVGFTVKITVAQEDPSRRATILSFLSAVARKALNGSNLGGTVLPGLTLVQRGVIEQPRHPEQSINLAGSFTTLETDS